MIFFGKPTRLPGVCAVLLFLSGACLLSSCGEKKDDKAATQTAAKVNRSEITVHQINFLLQQRRVPAEQASVASKEALERLIDQELTLQKAAELKIDRDVKVMQQLEAARRDIVARAYIERIVNGVSEPTVDDVREYYDKHPALFKERRVFTFQEVNIPATPDKMAELRSALSSAKNIGAFMEMLKAKSTPFTTAQVTKGAEQLPLASLAAYAKLKDGQTVLNTVPSGVQVLVLLNSVNQPVSLAQAQPAIEQFLLNERKRVLIESDLDELRTNAKIEYVGDYVKQSKTALPTSPESPKELK
ncbi:MAG: EpsD family peptidyl-prolyl cis-trans isomerase [Pseudomonadota bacterium]